MFPSRESHQPKDGPLSSKSPREFIQSQPSPFVFLNKEEKPPNSFFSENGLYQDILQVTQAEPDICLMVFYALYLVLLPQIETLSDISFKDAWTKFIGCSAVKGSLCPPEKLITERARDIKKALSQTGGESRVFQDLDQVMRSISHFKERIVNYSGQILQKEEIMTSIDLVLEFYLSFQKKVKALVQAIIEKEKSNIPHTLESDALEDLLEPKAIMMSDVFPQYWAYRIPRNQAQKLLSLDMYGRHLKSNPDDPSNHRVIALPENTEKPLVFFKANGNPPIQPGKEFILYSLYRHFHIPAPETALLILTDVFEANPNDFFAVQASEAVLGESPLKAYRDPKTTLDQEAYALQVIGTLLTNPSDGSFKNFKYSPKYQSPVSIDNDLVFKSELSGKGDKQIANVKSILYLYPQIDFPIPESVKTVFMTLDPHLTILSWLRDLAQKNQDYQLLFSRLRFQKTRCIYQNLLPQSETPSLALCLKDPVLVDQKLQNDHFYPQVLVSQLTLNHLTGKLQRIGKLLRNTGSISTQGLFEEVSLILGKYYRKLRLEFSDIEEALEALWGIKKNGIDYSYVSSLLDREEYSNSWDIIGSNETLPPKTFYNEYRDIFASESSPLDDFIMRHQERRSKNVLDLHVALKELQLLIQEDLINSQSIRRIADFRHNISKIAENDHYLSKEIKSIFSKLPHPELKWLFTVEKYFIRPNSSVPKDLIPTSLPVIGIFMKKRTWILTESDRQYLVANLRKNACLTCFPQKNPEFYLKKYPEWPGYEFASTSFMRLFGITHLPYQDLLIINSQFPTFITQKVNGQPVLQVWHNPQAFSNLDPFHTFLLIISAMLINPEDGKEDNFILSEDGKLLLPINYDHCFLPSTFQKEGGGFWNKAIIAKLQMKTLLFCLDEMKNPIPQEVKQHILSTDFDSLLKQWMVELDKLDNKINNLVDQDQRKRFLEHNTVMRILFYKQFIHNIYWKAYKIQEILRAVPEPTPFDLLNSIEPFVARCYHDSFLHLHDLQSRFKAATKQLYKKTAVDGSRMSVLNIKTMIEIINISEKELLSETMFQRMGPIDTREELISLIRQRLEKVGKEQRLVYEIDDLNIEVTSRAFSENPKEGLILKGISWIHKKSLRGLFTRNSGIKVRFLSLQNSHLLTENKIKILTEECPNLEYLNVSGSTKLKEISCAKTAWPLLVRLEAQDCPKLKKFGSYSPIKILRIGTSRKIEVFVDKSTLDVFKISNPANSFEFSFKKGVGFKIHAMNQTITIDNFVPHLLQRKGQFDKYFRDFSINFGTFSIQSENDLGVFVTVVNLKKSNIKARDIQTITTMKLPNLTKLMLSGNGIRGKDCLGYLIQGKWPKLCHLDLSSNEINDDGLKFLPFANWPLLETLDLTSTGVTKKGLEDLVRDLPNLKEIISDDKQ